MFDWQTFITNGLFPIGVTIYLLTRIEPALKDLTKSVTLLSIIVARTTNLDYDEIKKNFMNGGSLKP